MNKLIVLAVMAAVIAVASPARAEQESDNWQKLCPVMGGKINKEVFADHNGKRVYFCCPGCESKFKANAEAIIKKMEAEGIKLARAEQEGDNRQKLCPVMGGKINKEVFADHNGKRVYFCCPACQGKFKASADAMIKKMEAEGIQLDETPKG